MIRIGIDDIFVPTGEKLDLAKYCGIDPYTVLEKTKKSICPKWNLKIANL